MPSNSSQQPLTGLNVADFSWFAAGPICAESMAVHGATVVRVESESHMDGLRGVGPFPTGKTGYNVSGWYNNYNANKLNVTLNLNTEKGRDLAMRLVGWADVFITNITPRVIERWGFTYDQLVKTRPDIIAVYQPMQGFDGPHRDFLGFGAVLGPITGINHLTGYPNRPPSGMGTNYPDYVVNPQHTLTGGIYHQPGRKSIRPAHHQENRQGVGRGRDGVTAVGLRQHLLESAQGVAIIGQYVAGFTGPQVEGKPVECHVTVAPDHAPQQVFEGEAERQTAFGLSNDADIKAQADTFNGGPGPSGTIR